MTETNYDLGVVRYFSVATIIWGLVGMGVGLLLAGQLAWPSLNFDIPWLSYGRLRPLHTNAVVFAFGGCALMASAFYVVQKTCHTPLMSRGIAWFVFWGWQLVIVSAAITLPMGLTS
ncbi:MAG: cytochrome c oxidase cbb3-type subunit 1, partial [Candidatus Azotimanducaceae bacterium]